MENTEIKNKKKQLTGIVKSVKMDQTVIVAVTQINKHRKYNKTIKRTKRFAVHSADGEVKVGDTVKIEEVKPISRTKHFRLITVVGA